MAVTNRTFTIAQYNRMSTKMKTITLEDLQPWENPGDGWYHIERWGDHPQTSLEDKQYVQVIDDEAVRAIVAAEVPEEGILVDVEHVSVTGERDTRAYGWVRELAGLPTEEGLQLCARIEWTPLGLPLVRDRIYKHFSTVYSVELCADLGGGRLRPLQLVGLALTNQPNNPGQRPITNCQAAPPINNTNQNTKMEELKKIAAKLGLPEDATLEQVEAAIDALMAAEQEAAEAEAETLLNSEELKDLPDEARKDLKDELLTNRDLGIKMIKLLINRKGGGAPPVTTPRYARPGYRPDTRATKGAGVMDTERGKLLVNTARDIQAKEKAAGRPCSFWKAKNLAKVRLGQK